MRFAKSTILALGLVGMGGAMVCAQPKPEPAKKPAPKAEAKPRAPVEERSRLDVQPAGHAFKQLTIENPLGDVRIEGYDGSAIMIETHKHAPDADTLDRLRVSLVPSADGTVRITTTADGGREVRPVSRGQVHIDLIIRAPHDAHIEASVGSGRIDVENMDAGGELDSSSGAIGVKNVSGEVLTHSVSGATSLMQVFGSVDAATISSDLDLDTINGDKLVASASKGRIAGRRVRSRDIELTTTDGKIVLEAEAALRGHLVVSSLRGDVDVRLRRHGGLLVRARGQKVDLGAQAQAIEHKDGWSQASIAGARAPDGGHGGGDPAAMVELQSRYGMVQFAIIE